MVAPIEKCQEDMDMWLGIIRHNCNIFYLKDDEDVQEEVVQGPDIPVVQDQEIASAPPTKPSLPLEEKVEVKPIQAKPVKTPDEVEDLPEHEAVEPEVISTEAVTDGFEGTEEKIILDQQEKETVEEKEVSEVKVS